MNRKYMELDIRSITQGERIRRTVGDLESLVASVRHLGLLFPVVVDRRNVLISGARRLEACRRAGLASIPAWQMDTEADSMSALEIQSAENLCREPLSPSEIEGLIQSKKSALAGGSGQFATWLKRLFVHPRVEHRPAEAR